MTTKPQNGGKLMEDKYKVWLETMKTQGWKKKVMMKFDHDFLSESDGESYYEPSMIGSDFPFVEVWTQEDSEVCYEGDDMFIGACYEE